MAAASGNALSAAATLPHVAIVIVNWNGWRDTIDCVRSCLTVTGARVTILVCDNASGDGSVERISDWAEGRSDPDPDPDCPLHLDRAARPRGFALLDRAQAEAGEGGEAQLILVRTGGNLGFAGGNNVALRWGLARDVDYAWLLNNDAVTPPDGLQPMIETCSADPTIGLCGSTLVEYFEPKLIQAYAAAVNRRTFRGRHLGFRRRLDELDRVVEEDAVRPDEILYPVGASMLATRAFLREVGLMEEGYFLYYEEADWVLRAEGRFKGVVAPRSLIYHKGGASAGSTPTGASLGSISFLYRSRLRIARRLAPGSASRVLLAMADESARQLLKGRPNKAIAFWRALTGRVKVPQASGSGTP